MPVHHTGPKRPSPNGPPIMFLSPVICDMANEARAACVGGDFRTAREEAMRALREAIRTGLVPDQKALAKFVGEWPDLRDEIIRYEMEGITSICRLGDRKEGKKRLGATTRDLAALGLTLGDAALAELAQWPELETN